MGQELAASASGDLPTPTVSIGLPVYNGETYLRLALDSLLAQDYEDFELIICDNASTDATGEICREYRARDSRIHYYRHETNRGATANFRCVFELSASEYFMWASHDDIWDTRYIRKCLTELEKKPAAVMCCTDIVFLDQNGDQREGYPYNNYDTTGLSVQARVHALISTLGWYAIYGLMRSDAVRRAGPFVDAFGNDVLWLLHMTLLGEFIKLPEPLFYYRIPNKTKSLSEYMDGLNPDKASDVLDSPYTTMARDLRQIIDRSNLDDETKRLIQDDFVETLSLQNLDWQACIVRENEHVLGLTQGGARRNTLEILRAAPEQMRAFVAEAIKLDGEVDGDRLRQAFERAENIGRVERLRASVTSLAQGDPEAALREYLSMARSYANIGAWDGARMACELALELDPSRQETRQFLEELEGPHDAPRTAAACASVPSLTTTSPAPCVKWGGTIFHFSGYSRLNRDTILALDRRGTRVAIDSFAHDEQFVAQLKQNASQMHTWQRLLRQHADGKAYLCCHPPTDWSGRDVFEEYRRRNPGFATYVGCTMFETDSLPIGWARACNGMDEVWVPSVFNRETFARAGVDPDRLHVIPFGLDLDAYDPARVTPLRIGERRGFVFLSTFQWSKRKGWDVLLRAYLSAFTASDDVCLLLRTYPDRIKMPPIRERIERYVRSLSPDPERVPTIVLLEDFVPEQDMPSLYATADAYVLPTRGEGWGIPYMEAMAMGLPVIGTRWSAHLDFMNDDNSYLVDVEGLAPVSLEQGAENPFYTPDQRWAEPSVTHTAALMRQVFENRDEARTRGARARQEVVRNWSIDRTAEWITQRLIYFRETRQARVRRASRQHPSLAQEPVTLASTGTIPVLWQAPIFDPSGYADEARSFIVNLEKRDIYPALKAVGRHSERFRGQLHPTELRSLDRALARKPSRDFISVLHFPAYAFARLPEARHNVGRVMFETDGLPADWVEKCNQMDEIWVPTRFNMQTFRDAGVRSRLIQIPGGIDTDRFCPDRRPLPVPGAKGTVFLSMFVWSYRKGWDVLLRAWAEAFQPEDDVCLVLRTYTWSATDEKDSRQEIDSHIDRFLREKLGRSRQSVAPIIVLGKQLSEVELPRLFTGASAYVAPSRGEGWGRPHMQAMACGLPVIATGWSGNTEFMTDENSLLLDIEGLVEIGQEGEFPQFLGQRWAEPSAAHLSELLRWVYKNTSLAAKLGRRARQDMVEHWGWEQSVAMVAARLREIQTDLAGVRKEIERPIGSRTSVRWEGSQFVHHSLALVNRELCIRLAQDEEIELSIIPYEPDQFGVEADRRFEHIASRVNRRLSHPTQVHVRHQWPPNLTPPQEGRWVVVQPWEFGSPPRAWLEVMRDHVDDLWVPSNYVRDCYVQGGMPADRVHVVPNGVDVTRFHPDVAPTRLKTRKRFKFLFVGGTIWRKGIDVLLETYTRTFTSDDDVCLVIKDMGGDSFYKGQTAAQSIRQYRSIPHAPEIEYIERTLSIEELSGLYTACDCLVHPYRGEGFGLPIAEAMASGLPVIVTGYGAALDFCDTETAYLIPAREVRGTEQKVGDLQTVDYPSWCEPDAEGLTLLLKHVVENRLESRRKGQLACARIRTRFTWEQACVVVRERLQSLCSQPIRRQVRIPQLRRPHDVEAQPALKPAKASDRAIFAEKWAAELPRQQNPDPALIRLASNRAPGKRILAIDFGTPLHGLLSGAPRLLGMLQALSAQGHAITFIGRHDPIRPQLGIRLQQMGIELHPIDAENLRRLGHQVQASAIGLPSLLQSNRYDAAIVYLDELTEQYLEVIRRVSPDTRVYVDTAGTYWPGDSRAGLLASQKGLSPKDVDARSRHVAIYRLADALIALTEQSRRHLVREVRGVPIHVVPDVYGFEADPAPPESRKGLLFVGDFRRAADVDAALYFCVEVLPRLRAQVPDISVTILGDAPPQYVQDLAGDGITLVISGADLEAYVRSHRMLIVPMRFGMGWAVSLGLASGLPVVTTSSGVEGILPPADRRLVLLGDEPQALSECVLRLHGDDALWHTLSEQGRAYAGAHHATESFVTEVKGLLDGRYDVGEGNDAGPALSFVTPDSTDLQVPRDESAAEDDAARRAAVELVIAAGDQSDELRTCLERLQRFQPAAGLTVTVAGRKATIPRCGLHARACAETVESALCGALATGAEYVVLLGSDVLVNKHWLDNLLSVAASDPCIAAVGPTSNVALASQRVKQGYRSLKRELERFAAQRGNEHKNHWQDVSYLGGFCLLLKGDCVRQVGGLPAGLPLADALWDLHRRLRAQGFKLAVARGVYVHHDRLSVAEGADYKMRADVEAAMSSESPDVPQGISR